jgi:archaemetzincin
LTDLSQNKILISPIGIDEPSLLEQVGEKVADIFGYPVNICEQFNNIEFAYSPERHQYNSTLIINKLSETAPGDYLKVIAICKKDLFIPILTYVFGEAQLNGRSCIVSTYRLKDTKAILHPEEVFVERVMKEAVHELGHTFSIRHCSDSSCVMHYCRSLGDVDIKKIQLCRYCNVMLEDERKRIEKQAAAFVKDFVTP